MVNIFTCMCPNRSGVGVIDSPDRFEQVLDQRYIPEVSEKNFTHDISMIRRQKMVIFGVLKVFVSNFIITFTKGNLRYLRGRSMPFVFPYDF